MDKLFILFVVVGVIGLVLALLTAWVERRQNHYDDYLKRMTPEKRARKAKGKYKWLDVKK